jgi:lipopolysaccharide transport system ATP-binding protein
LSSSSTDVIIIENVTKHFRKRTIQRHHTTLKTEFIRWLLRRERPPQPQMFIESLKGINLRVPQGKTVGIIGRNGAGKSTLLKIITGIYTPTSGTVEVSGRISALLDLGAGFHPDFSGRENILINGIILGMSRSEIRARMDAIIDFSELSDFIDEPVRTYSSGMYMRLAFAVATHVDPEILVIDEILAVGDEHFSRKSRAKMTEFKRDGKTIVLVSHDLATVQAWCDMAAWIDGGVIRAVGNPRDVVAQYREAVELGEAQAASLAAVNSVGARTSLTGS